MDRLIEYLDVLPLNAKQKLVLAVLYERGPIAVSRLALIAKTERTLTYKIVKELERKNYAHAIKTDTGLVYKAHDIESVIFEQERGIDRLRQASDYVKEIRQKKAKSTDLLIFEGDDGIRKALYYGMESAANDELLGIYGGEYEPVYVELFNERQGFSKNRNIRSKIIFPYATEAATDFMARATANGYATDCRIANAQDPLVRQGLLHASIEIFQNVLKIYSYAEKRAIVITDSQAVDMERLIFSMLWEKAQNIE